MTRTPRNPRVLPLWGRLQAERMGLAGFFEKRPGSKTVAISALCFFAIVCGLALHRYLNFYASEASFDQGIFNQVFWNGLHGRFFQSSLSSTLSASVTLDDQIPKVGYHRLGQHFTPALLLWLPIYALYPNVITLSILQVVLVTAAGLVLFVLAREHGLAPALAATLTISFYCATAVIGPTLQNFHDFSQLPLFVFGMLYALHKRWWWLYAPLAILIPMAREDSGVILFSLGVFLVLSRKAPRLGVGLCIYSVAYILLVTNVMMPMFSEDVSQRFAIERFGQYVDGDSASTLDLIVAMLQRPWLVALEIVQPFDRTLAYLLGQWLPLAFVCVISPSAWLASGFPLLLLLVAQGQTVLSITTRYALAIVPGLFYGTMLWWTQHPNGFRAGFRRFWTFCIVLSLLFTLTPNPHRTFSFLIPDSFEPRVHATIGPQWKHAAAIRPLLREVPRDRFVAATSHLVPHLSSRREIVRLPATRVQNDEGDVVRADYLLADLWQLEQYQVAFSYERQQLSTITNLIDNMLERGIYGVVAYADGAVLLQRKASNRPEVFQQWLEYRERLQLTLSRAGLSQSERSLLPYT